MHNVIVTLVVLGIFYSYQCSASISPSPTANTGELVLLQVLFRHGDRSPDQTFPTDPIQEDSWPGGFGVVSKIGTRQQYELGQYFRQRYIDGNPHHLLSSNYVPNEIRIRSLDLDRTLMSAYTCLAGLFPPSGYQQWNPNITWQPIPVHTTSFETDNLLNMQAYCPKADNEHENILNSDQAKEEEKLNKDFFVFVKNATGLSHYSFKNIWLVTDPLLCEEKNGFPLPEWANASWKGERVYNKLRNLYDRRFVLAYDGPILKRLRGGVLLGEMVNNIKNKMESPSSKTQAKCHAYSARDINVVALTSSMNVFNGITPPYATAVMVELIKVDREYFVQLFYRNDSTRDPYILTIPGCKAMCPWNQFYQLVKDNIPNDWYWECQVVKRMIRLSKYDITLIVLSGCLMAFSCVVVTVGVVMVIRRRYRVRRHDYESFGDVG